MKKLILIFAAVAMLLPSCKKINEALDSLDGRLDKLEQETIPSIDEQISAINTTLGNLDAMDKELKGYIDNLTATASSLQEQINATNTKIDEVKKALQKEIEDSNAENLTQLQTAKSEVLAQLATAKTELENELKQINITIETLKEKDKDLDKKIAELRSYVDTELGETTDWVSATFATLEQYNDLVSEIATIKEQIKAINESITNLETKLTTKINEDIATAVSTLNADIQQKVKEITEAYTAAVKTAKEEITAAYTAAIQNAINALDVSLKAWVGEQLANYYTIAEVEAKITALQTAITEGDAALQEELKSLKSQLETTAAEITAAYKKAIEEAISTNNGVIDTKIANEIASVNQRINNEVATINAKIAEIESRLDNVEAKIAELLARIQSVSYIPTYDDGKATVKYNGNTSQVTLDFEVSPKDAVVELAKVWQSAVSVKAVYTQTRAVSFIDMPIVKFESDAVNGIISITASAENLSADFFASTQSASARLSISDGNNTLTSEYISLIANSSIPNNEIWYTTTDGNILTPYKGDDNKNLFGANIISNNCKNGKGVIQFDGRVTSIEKYAFNDCRNLTGITIPDSVTSIGDYAFNNCIGMKGVDIPKNVTTIGMSAFQACTGLKYVSIPDSITSIGIDAFANCISLTNVYITDLRAWCNISFDNYRSNPLYNDDANLYINNELATHITIPSNITEIKNNTFRGCLSLEGVMIPNSVTSIGMDAFAKCYSLTSVVIPNSITNIDDSAFYYCTSLSSITIPSSVSRLGTYAFEACSSLNSVYCQPLTPPINVGPYTFSSFDTQKFTIYVPRTSVDTYKTADGWKHYAKYIVGHDF